MKLHDDVNPNLNTVTAYGDGFIEINQARYELRAVSFAPVGPVQPWPANAASDISADLLFQACGLTRKKADPLAFLDVGEDQVELDPDRPAVLLVGTGNRQVMLATQVISPILCAGVGVEVMSTPAAARTYNILMAEGRQVVAALILENA